jgi:hypothetical protein
MANLEALSFAVLRDADGDAYLGAKASYWADVGHTLPLNTYSDAGLTAPNTNPVVADGTTGTFGPIYLQAMRYWRTVTTAAGVSLPQFDGGPIDANVTIVTSPTAPSPTYPLMYWYNTTDGHLYRRNQANNAWLDFGLIDTLINAASIAEQMTGTETGKVSTPDSVAALWQRGSDIASAATLSLPSTGGTVFNVTGTTTVAGISAAMGGRSIKLKFAGALQLTHNATSFILPGGVNATTAAGDTAEFINEAATDASSSNWRCVNYQRNASAFTLADFATQAQMETGTSLVTAVPPGRQQFHPGHPKVFCNWDNNGSTGVTGQTFNVSSLTDAGVALSVVNFTTSFTNPLSYGVVTGCSDFAGDAVPSWQLVRPSTAAGKAVGSCRFVGANGDFGASNVADFNDNNMACFGDQ